MLLDASQIRTLCQNENMISPFNLAKIRQLDGQPAISYGMSGHGYDIRLSDKDIFMPVTALDPKNIQADNFEPVDVQRSHNGSYFIIPGNSMVLCRSVEYFRLPPFIFGIAVGKSTYARVGIFANITPLESGWHGILTIELANHHTHPVRVYTGEGIAQILFFVSGYQVYEGRYQGQQTTTHACI